MTDSYNIIYCIGDSHVSFFSGSDKIQPIWPKKSKDIVPFLKTYHIGPVLAYNLGMMNTHTKGRESLFYLLNSEIPAGAMVMLCFGEIDCRAHLLKQARLQNRDICNIVEECAVRYFSVIMEIMEMGYEVLIWNVIPSTIMNDIPNQEFPVFGTCSERNFVSKLFNNFIKQFCHENGCLFIEIFDSLVDRNGFTKMKYYIDNVHLSQKAMPKAIKEITKVVNGIPFRYRLRFIRFPSYSFLLLTQPWGIRKNKLW